MFAVKFVEERTGRWVLHKQVLKFRPHLGFPALLEVKKFVKGCLQLRDAGYDLAALAESASSGQPITAMGPKGPMKFSEFVRKVLPDVPNRKGISRKRLRGWKRERQRLEWMIRNSSFSEKFLHAISEREIRDWVEEREQTAGTSNTRHKIRLTVRVAFSAAVREGYLLTNPAAPITLPLIEEAQRMERSPDEIGRVCTVADNELYARILLGVYLGLEPFEQASLRWQHVNLNARQIRLLGSPPKRLGRVVWIHRDLLSALRKLKKAEDDRPIFCNKRGVPAAYPYRRLRKACARAGVRGLIPLELRDTFKRMLETAEVRDNVIEFLMGHKLPGLRRFYGKDRRLERIRAAIEALPSLPGLGEAQTG